MNEKLHPYLSLPSSPRVDVCFQVFVAGCMLTAVYHPFVCTSSVNIRYFEQRTSTNFGESIIDANAINSFIENIDADPVCVSQDNDFYH